MTKQQAAAALQQYPLTALNIATTGRYVGCIAAGGHRFSSGKTVTRDLGGQGIRIMSLGVCDVCDVPIVSKSHGNRSSMRVVA